MNEARATENSQATAERLSEQKMKYFIIDAFTDQPFGGNPAGVVLLDGDTFPTEELMVHIAAELRYWSCAVTPPSPRSQCCITKTASRGGACATRKRATSALRRMKRC